VYHIHFWYFLLLEATALAFPLLKVQYKDVQGRKVSWLPAQVSFGERKALLHLHRPSTDEHLHNNRTR
jgi:hypothetical protein